MGLIPQSLLRIVGGQRSVVAMVWNRGCHGVEPACGNDGAFPSRNGFEAYLCSVMGLIPRSLLRIVGGQRSVVAMVWNRRCHGVEPALPWCGTGVAMVWNRRVETTERFPAEMVSRRICAAWSGMRSAKQAQKRLDAKCVQPV